MPGRGQDLFTKCIRGDFGSPGRAGWGGESPTPGLPSPAARHSACRRPRLDSVGSVTRDDAPAAQLGARRSKPRVVGLPDCGTVLNDLTAAMAADRVYESVGALAADRRAQLAALEASREFRPLQRPDFSRGCQASWRRCRAHRVSSPSCLTLGRSQLTIATIMRVVEPGRGNSLVRDSSPQPEACQ